MLLEIVFGCNNILDTEKIEKKHIYLFEGNYFKTNGEDLEFSKNVVFTNDIWLLSLLSSKMHLIWIKAICGRLKDDYRYSPFLLLNR